MRHRRRQPAKVRGVESGYSCSSSGLKRALGSSNSGGGITHLRATSPTLLLVTGLALCSRTGAALLDIGAPPLGSRETPSPDRPRVRDDAIPDQMLSRHRYAKISPAQHEGGCRSPRRSMFELLRGPLPFAGVAYRAGRGNRRSGPPLGCWSRGRRISSAHRPPLSNRGVGGSPQVSSSTDRSDTEAG